MIAWLRRTPRPAAPPPAAPHVRVGDRVLPLHIRRLAHARRMTLRLAPNGGAVRVSMPDWTPIHEAQAFAAARADWLAQQIARLPGANPPRPGGTVMVRGTTLTIVWTPTASRRPVVAADQLVIGGPLESLCARIARWLEAEALRLVREDVAHYCAQLGQPVPTLALSRAQRRWGSCAANRTIRINWRLVMAPDAVRRSVVAHEVAHLRHFDHSPAFHAMLGTLFEGNIAAANAWLKQHGRALYQPFG